MVGRTRQIKYEFFLNHNLAKLSPETRLLFIGLWTIADREGRLKDIPEKIHAQLFPYNPEYEIDKMLDSLTFPLADPFIVRYKVGIEEYIEIKNFKNHQHCHVRETPSNIPAPDITNQGDAQAIPKTYQGDTQAMLRLPTSTSTSTSTSTRTTTSPTPPKNENIEMSKNESPAEEVHEVVGGSLSENEEVGEEVGGGHVSVKEIIERYQAKFNTTISKKDIDRIMEAVDESSQGGNVMNIISDAIKRARPNAKDPLAMVFGCIQHPEWYRDNPGDNGDKISLYKKYIQELKRGPDNGMKWEDAVILIGKAMKTKEVTLEDVFNDAWIDPKYLTEETKKAVYKAMEELE